MNCMNIQSIKPLIGVGREPSGLEGLLHTQEILTSDVQHLHKKGGVSAHFYKEVQVGCSQSRVPSL